MTNDHFSSHTASQFQFIITFSEFIFYVLCSYKIICSYCVMLSCDFIIRLSHFRIFRGILDSGKISEIKDLIVLEINILSSNG